MFDSAELRDELQALKNDVSRLLNTAGAEIRDTSKSKADALSEQINAVLQELGETLGEQEERVGEFVADRPITSLASAFALGVVVGVMLRRH
jgi:ElaB/YqjD/DUF883 family membrane-anchored ribosome-binding protein